jgi:hypothetical protein
MLMCGLDCQWARRGSINTSLGYAVEGPIARFRRRCVGWTVSGPISGLGWSDSVL